MTSTGAANRSLRKEGGDGILRRIIAQHPILPHLTCKELGIAQHRSALLNRYSHSAQASLPFSTCS
jgi:hypothetical protein